MVPFHRHLFTYWQDSRVSWELPAVSNYPKLALPELPFPNPACCQNFPVRQFLGHISEHRVGTLRGSPSVLVNVCPGKGILLEVFPTAHIACGHASRILPFADMCPIWGHGTHGCYPTGLGCWSPRSSKGLTSQNNGPIGICKYQRSRSGALKLIPA